MRHDCLKLSSRSFCRLFWRLVLCISWRCYECHSVILVIFQSVLSWRKIFRKWQNIRNGRETAYPYRGHLGDQSVADQLPGSTESGAPGEDKIMGRWTFAQSWLRRSAYGPQAKARWALPLSAPYQCPFFPILPDPDIKLSVWLWSVWVWVHISTFPYIWPSALEPGTGSLMNYI